MLNRERFRCIRACVHFLPENSRDEVRAPGKVPIDRADSDTRALSNIAHRRVNTGLGKDFLRRLEERYKVPPSIGAYTPPGFRRPLVRLVLIARSFAHYNST
jgi:hypothetical protein